MPPLLLRFLPQGLIALALLGTLVWIDHRGYARARRDDERERLVTAIMLTRAARESEARLTVRLGQIGSRVQGQIDALDTRHQTLILPALRKELTRETRYADPAAGISDELRAALNRIIPPVTCTAAAGQRIDCALPDARPAGEQ